ncbi:hypothetical protein EV385_6211 [Krasilnikovia cinnamomea]|uniref:Uncharacterized protein n=1 Tax=Krasilnikovia cinnamomea TaxID=349313 RepID=A0A4Q7ZUF5_9ACTN|nr:hypothetical protein [Krasilnikovia cinnamomea]RZU54263.1 hypothetical protein EV385_6211 [Krasilnikovia cinnamomea]
MSDHLWPDFPDDPGHSDPGPLGGHDDDLGLPDVFDPGFGHDHGWDPDAAHDDLSHDDLGHDDPGYHHDAGGHDLGHDPGHEPGAGHAEDPHPDVLGHVGADPDAWDDTGHEAVSVFPPVLDVGPLPEPVDGFPWIDTGSLGLVDPAAVHLPTEQPDPAELAAYAATDLPPGADPWAALADSDDPATSALAKWWRHDT